jgi:hypothetical protein
MYRQPSLSRVRSSCDRSRLSRNLFRNPSRIHSPSRGLHRSHSHSRSHGLHRSLNRNSGLHRNHSHSRNRGPLRSLRRVLSPNRFRHRSRLLVRNRLCSLTRSPSRRRHTLLRHRIHSHRRTNSIKRTSLMDSSGFRSI